MFHNRKALANLRKNGSTHISQPISIQTKTEESGEPIAYKDYINSAEWDDMRGKSAQVWGKACLCCQSHHHVERHHIFYRKHLEKASPLEIIPLCRECHEAAHMDGDNKNSEPLDTEAFKGILNRLFYKIIRVRGLPTDMISKCHKAFWKVFNAHANSSFIKSPPKAKKVKTKFNLRPGHNERKGKHWRKKNGKLKGLTADEKVAKANKGGRSFRIYPRFKTVENYQDIVKANEFVPEINLIKASDINQVDKPSQSP